MNDPWGPSFTTMYIGYCMYKLITQMCLSAVFSYGLLKKKRFVKRFGDLNARTVLSFRSANALPKGNACGQSVALDGLSSRGVSSGFSVCCYVNLIADFYQNLNTWAWYGGGGKGRIREILCRPFFCSEFCTKWTDEYFVGSNQSIHT